ncbi:MAG: hypothetical protein ACREMY_16615, partial [bacterium]
GMFGVPEDGLPGIVLRMRQDVGIRDFEEMHRILPKQKDIFIAALKEIKKSPCPEGSRGVMVRFSHW